MRDKYIELIINFVKEKPGYEKTLDDIKKEVLSLGATEAEFDEAIKKITGAIGSPSISTNEEPIETEFIEENTVQPQFLNKKDKTIKQIKNYIKTTRNAKNHKKLVAVMAFVLFLTVAGFQLLKYDNKPKNAIVATSQQKEVNNTTKPIVPIVYASSLTVEADKVFSVKSNKIQLAVTGKPKKEVLGFFPYWMLSKYNEIPLNTLTQISLFGLDTDAKGNIIKSGDNESNAGWAMWQDPLIDQLIAKARKYGLKITLTIKSFNSGNIDRLVASDDAQKNLIANTLYLVNSKNLDGVNIDFEYVGNPPETTRKGFTRFITNLNSELKRQKPNSILTVDTYLASGSDRGIFDIPAVALNSDAIVIMGYDMHTPNTDAGPVAAMGGATNVIGYVQNYLEKIDSSKIILAVPYYGYDWPKNKGESPVKILPYALIAEFSKNAQLIWDETSQTPSFSYKDDNRTQRIVHFDNIRSLAIKYDYINNKNLKGVGIWALGYDGNNQDLEKLLIDKFINK